MKINILIHKLRFFSIGLKNSKYWKESIVLDNFLMGPQITVSAHVPVEITKSHKVGLRYAVLKAGVCFRVLNGIKGQIIQRKTAIRGTEMSFSYCYYYIFIYSRTEIKIKIYNFVVKIYKINKTTT